MTRPLSDAEKRVGRIREQMAAAGIDHRNKLLAQQRTWDLNQQDTNLRDALASINRAWQQIDREVIATNRGGVKGMHGFIAEIAEVGVSNARSRILGGEARCQWVNDNGPVDLIRDGVEIQQKFSAAGGRFGLGAVTDHLGKYPDYISGGGKYQIPEDHYATVRMLHDMSPEEAGLLERGGEGPSHRDWGRVQDFGKDGEISIESLEPSALKYHEVQRDTIGSTLEAEKQSLRDTDRARRESIFAQSRPNLREGTKAAAGAAAVEGGAALVRAVRRKRRAGTRLQDFSAADWNDIAGETGSGLFQGGVRGISIYTLTNFTATPAAVASAVVTVSFGIAGQANKLRNNEITELEFIGNAESMALDAAVSALSALVGQALIPVPVLGAVIGTTVGTLMQSAVSSALSSREAALLEQYLEEQRFVDEQLSVEYRELIEALEEAMARYLSVLELAFSPDPAQALLGSVELALQLGVLPEEVLDSEAKARDYFLS